MPKVSIIIPVYNTESYLCQCLDSVTGQTLKDIEIICVDDGSSDGSLQILEQYAQKDARIRILHKENGGLVSARKAGAEIASGQYIGYVDSDDWVEPNMYEVLYEQAVSEKAELVSSGYVREGNYSTEHFDALPEGLYRGEDAAAVRGCLFYNMEEEEPGMRGSLCCKLLKASLLQKAQRRVPDGVTFSEDKLCLLLFVLDCHSVSIMKKAFYHYRIHPASLVNAPDCDYLLRVNEFYQCLQGLYSHENFTADMRRQAEIYVTELLILGINKRLGFRNRNMLWIDPYWLQEIPEGKRIVLYGGGEAGEKYRQQMESRPDLTCVCCIDFEPLSPPDGKGNVQISQLPERQAFDYIVITIKNPQKAEEVKRILLGMGVEEKRILWFEQKELFWRYVRHETAPRRRTPGKKAHAQEKHWEGENKDGTAEADGTQFS